MHCCQRCFHCSPFTLARDADGAVLIDRDGRYFGVLLNFLP